jgi:hypothetical protein
MPRRGRAGAWRFFALDHFGVRHVGQNSRTPIRLILRGANWHLSLADDGNVTRRRIGYGTATLTRSATIAALCPCSPVTVAPSWTGGKVLVGVWRIFHEAAFPDDLFLRKVIGISSRRPPPEWSNLVPARSLKNENSSPCRRPGYTAESGSGQSPFDLGSEVCLRTTPKSA